MASPSLRYGPRISDEEYERRVVALNTSAAEHGKDRDGELRRAELNLALDHQLGEDFPADRRRMLWEAHERIERRRRRLALRSLLTLMRTRSSEGATASLARDVVRAYAEVLTRPELEAFFGKAANAELSRQPKREGRRT
jgi:acyl-CoA reductase-like NAD-dependent aldehyde dehydrogenase